MTPSTWHRPQKGTQCSRLPMDALRPLSKKKKNLIKEECIDFKNRL